MTKLLSCFAFVSLLAACGPTASGACRTNGDCVGFEVCLDGACVTPQGAGGGGGQNTGGGTAQSGGGSGTVVGTCCVNGAFYACGTSQAFEACAGPDVGACHAACGVTDFTCHMSCDTAAINASHDPSQCTRDSARDGSCTLDSCNDLKGSACSYSSQCSTDNCTDGYCRGNAVGDRCSYSSQCSSNNCTDGCCRGNDRGSKCSYSSQCTSNNCTDGVCQ